MFWYEVWSLRKYFSLILKVSDLFCFGLRYFFFLFCIWIDEEFICLELWNKNMLFKRYEGEEEKRWKERKVGGFFYRVKIIDVYSWF